MILQLLALSWWNEQLKWDLKTNGPNLERKDLTWQKDSKVTKEDQKSWKRKFEFAFFARVTEISNLHLAPKTLTIFIKFIVRLIYLGTTWAGSTWVSHKVKWSIQVKRRLKV